MKGASSCRLGKLRADDLPHRSHSRRASAQGARGGVSPTDEVLVIDDDKTVLTILSSTLRSAGYQCRTSSDPAGALDQVVLNPAVSVVVSDIYMPSMTGFQLIDRLSAQPLPRPCPRFLLLTAQPSLQSVVDALRLGACDFLTKPVRTPDLLAAVERAMRRAIADRRDYESPMARVERLIEQSQGLTKALRQLVTPADDARGSVTTSAVADRFDERTAKGSAVLDMIEVLRELRGHYAQHKLDDIAWDLLLELARAERQERRIAVSGLMVSSANVSATTLLRRVNELTERGYLSRVPDPNDARRNFVELAPKARELVSDFLEKAQNWLRDQVISRHRI